MSPTRRDLANPEGRQSMMRGYSINFREAPLRPGSSVKDLAPTPSSGPILSVDIDSVDRSDAPPETRLKLFMGWGEVELMWLAAIAYQEDWGSWRFRCPGCEKWYPFLGAFLRIEEYQYVTVTCTSTCKPRLMTGTLRESDSELKSKRIVEVDPN